MRIMWWAYDLVKSIYPELCFWGYIQAGAAAPIRCAIQSLKTRWSSWARLTMSSPKEQESHGPKTGAMSRTQQYRKVLKPLLERKRRARINRCVEDLKNLLMEVIHMVSGVGKPCLPHIITWRRLIGSIPTQIRYILVKFWRCYFWWPDNKPFNS